MANCSVCGAATSSVKSPTYPAAEFRKLVANGFRPQASSLKTGELTEQAWLEKVAQSEQDYILCAECVERAAPYRPQLRKGRSWLPFVAVGAVIALAALVVIAILRAPKEQALSLRRLAVAEAYFTSVDLSPDSSLLAAGSADHSITLWDLKSGEVKSVLEKHSERVNDVAFAPEGGLLASASNDRTISLWDPLEGAFMNSLLVDGGLAVSSLAFSPDGSALASGHYDNAIRLWTLATPGAFTTLASLPNAPTSLAYTPDGLRLASGCLDGAVYVLDSQSGAELLRLAGHARAVNAIAISPDGQWLASAGQDGALLLWDLQSGEKLRQMGTAGKPLYAVAFSPDGKLLAAGGEDGFIRLWQPESGELVNSLLGYEGETFPITGLDFSTDGASLANSSTFDVKLWDMNNLPTPPAP